MARNKDSKFGAADGFDFADNYTQDVQEERTRSTRSTTDTHMDIHNRYNMCKNR